jgi:hypothetical protein
VQLGVVTARLGVMLFGVTGVPVGGVGMMRCLLVVAGLMVLGGLAMVFGGVLVMFGSLLVMFHALMLAHVALPVAGRKRLRKSPDAALTRVRQVCCGDLLGEPAKSASPSRNRH